HSPRAASPTMETPPYIRRPVEPGSSAPALSIGLIGSTVLTLAAPTQPTREYSRLPRTFSIDSFQALRSATFRSARHPAAKQSRPVIPRATASPLRPTAALPIK